MKKNVILSVIFFLAVATMAFTINPENRGKAIENVQPKILDLNDFSKVGLSISGDVYIKQGQPYKVEVEASDRDFDKLILEVRNNMLHIETRNFINANLGSVKIYISCPDIEMLNVAGSGKIMMQNDLSTEELEMNVAGSGDIILRGLSAEEVSAHVSGSGKIMVENKSKAEELKVRISGSGKVLAKELMVEESEISISGSGDCETYTNGSLTAKVTGSGSVYYQGKPKIDASTVGSGRIHSL